jgi:hypothetical protein
VTLTTTIRREPMLLVEDSINFTDAIGRKYTLQYEYFKYWCVSAPVLFPSHRPCLRVSLEL